MQWLGLVLLGIVGASLIAWMYLSISAQASIAGREIQDYRWQKSKSEQSIAALETELALITSSTEMAKRAKQLGFKELSPERFDYMVISGFSGKPSAMLAPKQGNDQYQPDVITPAFTQSLWDWLYLSYVEPAMNR